MPLYNDPGKPKKVIGPPAGDTLVVQHASVDQPAPNLNKIFPLRFGFSECSNASLNWSSG